MKKTVKGILVPTGAIFLVAFLYSQSWALSLSFNPSSSLIGVGDLIDVDIVVSDLTDDVSGLPVYVGAFDLEVNYDASILSFNSYSLGNGLGDIAAGDADDWSCNSRSPRIHP